MSSNRPLKRKLTETSNYRTKRQTMMKYVPYRAPRYTGIRKVVREEIQNAAERKIWISYAANVNINTATNVVPSWINLVPILSQGQGNSQRIGNEVRVVKGEVNLVINILPYNNITNTLSTPVRGRIWLCYPRKYVTTNLGSTNIAADFFEVNNGNVGFQGNMLDMVLTPNKDSWAILEERIFDLGATSATSSGAVGTAGYFDNSKMSLPFSFDYGKYISKLHYDDGASAGPTNKSLFLVMQLVYADGSTNSVTPGEAHYNCRVEYTDL